MDRLACVDLGFDADTADDEPPPSLLGRLRRFSPEVEPSRDDPGIYWLSASGLDRLFSSLDQWAQEVREDLEQGGFDASVVVGFSKFGTYALAKTRSGVLVLGDPQRESEEVCTVPLKALRLFRSSELASLVRLGKRTVGDLLELSSAGLLERFGPEVHRVFASASGALWRPIVSVPPKEPIKIRVDFETPESDALRLTFLIKGLLHKMLRRVADKKEAVTTLEISLKPERLERLERRVEIIKTAAPTLDEVQMTDLVRLRLESIDLKAGVIEVELTLKTVTATLEQIQLFKRTARDLTAADRSLARLRAEFGKNSVTRAVLKKGHLPEASFAFEPLESLSKLSNTASQDSKDSPPTLRTLVRRIHARPIPLQTRPVVGPRGCHLQGMGEAPAVEITGPYIVSGGWWVNDIHREYYFVQTEAGRILWVYFDKKRRRWFLQGEVA